MPASPRCNVFDLSQSCQCPGGLDAVVADSRAMPHLCTRMALRKNTPQSGCWKKDTSPAAARHRHQAPILHVVSVVGRCWMLLVAVSCCWALPGVVGCCWLCCQMLLGIVGCCWMLSDVVGLSDAVCCCWTLSDVVGYFPLDVVPTACSSGLNVLCGALFKTEWHH